MTEHKFDWSDLFHIIQAISNIAALVRFTLSASRTARDSTAQKLEGQSTTPAVAKA
jgi:hypothetical protein